MQSRRIFLLVGAVFMLCLSAMLVMMNTHTAPKLLVHKQDNAKHNDIAAAAISLQKPHNITLFNPPNSKHQIHQQNAQKHDLAGNEIEENKFEENEVEEEEERGANPGFQKQLEMMLRDPKSGVIPDGIGYREREFVKTLPSRNGTVGRQFREKGTSELQASNLTWQARGPSNIGGRTRTVAIDVSNENVIIAGGVGGGGIWRSTNKGQSWQRMTSNPQAPSATALAQDKRPGKQNIWYCGTGEFYSSGFPTKRQGILKSTDGGLTWQPLPSTMGLNTIENIFSVVTKTTNLSQDEVIAATNGGIMRSLDGGASWTTVIPTSTTSARTHVTISSTGILYAVVSDANRKVYRSTDGVNWVDISPPNFQTMTQSFQRGILAVAPSNPNVVYMLFSREGYGTGGLMFMKYAYLSGDGSGAGGIWENRSTTVNQVSGLAMGSYNGYCLSLNVHPQNENVVFLGAIVLYRSLDGFQTSLQASKNLGTHADHHTVEFFSDGRAVGANDGGVYITNTSALQTGDLQWSSLNSGYLNTQFYHVAIDEQTSGSNVVMGGMQDNGTYLTATNGLSAWQGTGGGDGAYSIITKWGADRMVYSSSQNGIVSSRRILNSVGGLSNYSFSKIDPINAGNRLFIHPYFLDPNSDSVMYYPGGKSLWRHDNLPSIPASGYDQITGWKEFANIAPTSISAIGAAKGAVTRLYVGAGGTVLRIDDARLPTLTPVNVSIIKGFPLNGYCRSIAIDPTNADRATVVFSNYNVQSLFYTTDAGNTWQPIGGNLEQFPDGSGNGPACISAAIVHYQGQTTYFVGTSAGLYSTTTLNGMNTTWMLEDAVPPGVAVMHIAKRDADGFVAVATHGAGVYSTFLGGAPPVSTVSLTGVVRENSSPLQPLQGVTITLSNGAQTTTNAAGAYSFTNLPQGVYSVSVNFPNGYYATSKSVLKDLSQQSGTQDFLLETIKISGKITVNNVGLANVSVSNGVGMTVMTNAQGDYLFNKVNAGAYTITPTLAGFTFTPTNRAVSISNTPNPPAPTVYGTATAVNFTAQGTLNLSASALTIGPAGVNNAGIMVTANVAWTVSSNQAWASVTPTSGNGNGSFSVNVVANPNTTPRTATLTVTGGGITRTIAITQNGTVPATLTVSQQAFTVPAAGQNGLSATITSNVAWTASSNQA
ncbi:MAG: SdrD B-like domain-containing protein, partial [Candidatus Kapaibacteriota bacterium]